MKAEKTQQLNQAGSPAKTLRKTVGRLSVGWWIFFIMLPIAASFAALSVGRMNLNFSDVFDSFRVLFTGAEETTAFVVILKMRLPRILLALLAGAGLSVAGMVFQSLFRNPLATPDTVGISSGASFGAALGILLGLTKIGVQGLSFVMGIAALVMTYLSGSGKGKSLNSIVLSGIMIGSLFTALVSLVKFAADPEQVLPAITYFLMGSLTNASYETVLIGAVPILAGIIVLFLLRWRLNLLPYGEEEVRSFGVSMKGLRTVSALLATLMVSSAVSMCGQVGWVGLLVPHICRMKFKNNHLSLMPATVSVGAVFLLLVDTVARSVTAAEIPVSVLTALAGAPFFIYLMRKTGGWRL